MRLSHEQRQLLVALVQGDQLKVHRDLEGQKVHRLHRLESGKSEDVPDALVTSLLRYQLIESNMKFPAATYLLTTQGAQMVADLLSNHRQLLMVRRVASAQSA